MHRMVIGLLCCASLASGAHATGHLRIESARAGRLEVEHAAGWTRTSALEAGVQTIWDLPAGEVTLRFTPDSEDAAHAPLRVALWDQLTTRVAIDGEARLSSSGAGHDDARGTLLLLPAALSDRLPGAAADQLAALDTHTRWRPGASLDGRPLASSTERRESLPSLGPTAGQAASSLAPGGALEGVSSIWYQHSRAQGLIAAGARARTPTAVEAEMAARLPEWAALGVPLRAEAYVRTLIADSADPRAVGKRVLPDNDAREIDLAGTIELGPAAPGSSIGSGAAASGARSVQGPSSLGRGGWGLRLDAGGRGLVHDHYLQVYRYDSEHAPREEAAALWGRADATFPLGRRTRAQASFGLARDQSSLADGELRGDVRSYYRPGGNANADESGLYWQGPTEDALVDPHVFDYYQWKRTTGSSLGLRLTHAASADTRFALGLEGTRRVYRRFDHYSPTEIEAATGEEITQRALVIGYDPERGEPSELYADPGRALTARAAIEARTRLGALACRLSVGLLAFDAGDSALVDLGDPYGGGLSLGPEDLEPTSRHLLPEAWLGVRGGTPEGLAWWGLAWHEGHAPPLEALYSPRAYLTQISPEGVMGNPDLAPERELGTEIGCAFPAGFAGRRWRMGLAAYAGRIDEAISMTAAHIGEAAGLYEGAVPVYENGGTLRRGGLHVEASTGEVEGHYWLRVSYDYSRIESDAYESPLLDLRWILPDRVQGEYDSEGYATPLGGILDEWVARGAAAQSRAFHPANADRPHALSVALVREVTLPAAGPGWTLGALAILESGRPFTQVLVHPAGFPAGTRETERGLEDPAWGRALSGFPRNEARGPGSVRIDLALQRRWFVSGSALTLRLETLNLLGLRRANAVYRATGEPDEDGCAQDPGCTADHLGEIDAAVYAERLEAPENYDIPWTLRAQLSLELFR